MAEIELSMIIKAREAAVKYIKAYKVDSEAEFITLVIIFMQMINCIIYKEEGGTAKLSS